MNEPTNGGKYITWRDWHQLSTEIKGLLKEGSDAQTELIKDIVGRLNIISEAHRACNAEVAPVVKSYNTLKKWVWGLIATNTAMTGGFILPEPVKQFIISIFGG